MGMYTEINFTFTLKKDTDINVLRTMDDLIHGTDVEIEEIDHNFFKTTRRYLMFRCSSYYHSNIATQIFHQDKLTKQYEFHVHSDFKNYDGEIDKFLDWIKDYIDHSGKLFIGYSRYEETEEPTLYYVEDGKIINS